jgi:hypothetical protein
MALGRVYARAGVTARAREAYERGAALSRGGPVHVEALRALALLARRERRFAEAAAYWQRVIDAPACPGDAAREASEALAIHHEHRVRDLRTARSYALRSLELDGRRADAWAPARAAAVRYRVARIERKMLTGAGETGARLELGD